MSQVQIDCARKMIKRSRKNMAGSSSCGTQINEAVDFLSSLPDSVFTVIFSLLTTKEAFNTCISCKNLKHLMTTIPNVELNESENDCPAKKIEFVESVSRFLGNHDDVIRKFHLSFSPLGFRDSTDVRYWLSLVLKIGLEELDLVLNGRKKLVSMPSFLTAANLKVLKLRQCVNLSSITGLKSLQSLYLGSTYIYDSEMGLICCCESLQHLTLETCTGFSKIEIVNPKSKLETLILNDCNLPYSHFELKILNLKTLSIRLKIMNLFFVGSPHIDNLILCRQSECPFPLVESQHNLIDSLGNVRSLQLDGSWAFEWFTAYRSNHQMTKREKILLLDFKVCLKNIQGFTNLIGQAEGVKKLHISINENTAENHETYNTDRDLVRVLEHFLENCYRFPPTVALRNSDVRIINIQSFTGAFYELSHIRFMLENFPRLELLEVTPIKEMDEDQTRACAELISSFPVLSADVDIALGSMKFKICKNVEA